MLTLLIRLYVNLGEWDQLEQLLPELQKRKAISADESRELELRIYRKRMELISADPDALEQLWRRVPKSIRQDPVCVKTYVSLLVELGAGQKVAPLIVNSIQRRWDPELVCLYGRIKTESLADQLSIAESWLQDRPKDPDLLIALARLCLQNKLWGKARSYLEASIGISPRVEAYQELGLLLEQMDEQDKALECFRAGLSLERRETSRVLPRLNPALSNNQLAGPRVIDST